MPKTWNELKNGQNYLVGIDLGSSSLGWSVIACDDSGVPLGIVDAGVRRFEAGVLGDIEGGRDESRATARRDARGPRRQNFRRQRRAKKLFNLLGRNGLLPACEDNSPEARHQLFCQIDQQLHQEMNLGGDRVADHLLPYELRRRALDEKLPLLAIGRLLYQLAQRRGFLSNRKAAGDEEETGKVKSGIAELYDLMSQAEARTLGEYFATLDPEERRIRARWTSRHMFWDEFEQIWQTQAEHHAELTDELKQEVYSAIFFQRPLKSQKHLIGRCSIDPTKRRAPAACLPAQEFRYWQRLNDLRLIAPDGEITELNLEQKQQIANELNQKVSLTWAAIKTLLGLKKSKEYGRHWVFNFEQAGDKSLIGNRTAAKLADALGDSWTDLDEDEQEALVDEILSFDSETALAKRLETAQAIPAERAKAAARAKLEDDYTAYSRQTINRYLPKLKQGTALQTVRKALDPGSFEPVATLDQLPPVRPTSHDGEGAFPDLRNPAVERAMGELRKVVNAILRRTGNKPWAIRIELARDLKHGRKQRESLTKRRDQNTKLREEASERILREMNDDRYVTRDNILKVRLANDCDWVCPYTGDSFTMKQLVGNESTVEVEHIIPFSRSLDNSYANKTLCFRQENANKGNKTPWEKYHSTGSWDEIIARVQRFRGDTRTRKLQLFQAEKLPNQEEFTQKQLSDTRYIGKLATEYLGMLYGGKISEDRRMKVQVSPGRATAYLRQRWNLNAILGHPDEKERADHRHHAIDALVIALTDSSAVHLLSRAAEQAEERGGSKLFAEVDPPWEDFLNEADAAIKQINVSSRVSKKLNGPLHKETILSKPRTDSVNPADKDKSYHVVRKSLDSMSTGEVKAIVDDKVRELVEAKLKLIGGAPKKAFADPNNHPYLTAKDGRLIPIHKARIRKSDNPMPVGEGSKQRYVNPGSNHHLEIVAVLDKEGKEKKWEGVLVSRFEAMGRKSRGEPIIQRDHGQGRRFKFSLAGGEHILLEPGTESEKLCRVTVISGGQVEFVFHTDARPITLRKKLAGARIRKSANALMKEQVKKVVVSPLGRIESAGD